MVGHLAIPLRGNRTHPAYIDEKGRQLPGAPGQLLRPLQVHRIAREELRVMLAYHPRAGTGRGNDVVIARKRIKHLQGDRLRIGAITRIVGWLAATRLRTRDLDCATGLLEQFDGGKTDRRPEQIDKARHKQRHTHSWLRISGSSGN